MPLTAPVTALTPVMPFWALIAALIWAPVSVDMVIVAVGAGPNRALFENAAGLERNKRGYIRTFSDSGRTSVPRVWAGGDIVTGAATVILAMGAARKAADDIHAYLGDGEGAWV